jgi:enoyl-CoA hydratase/carnithine racemase
VDWKLEEGEQEEMKTWILGPLLQMTSLMLHEKRGHLSHINIIGELCAQFRSGVLALIRRHGADAAMGFVHSYHALHPEAAKGAWHPETFEAITSPEWQQLYVNAEHDGTAGVITIGREAYNSDVNAELNRAIDWLKSEGIERVIVTGDFHLSTQMVGADTSDFYPALEDEEKGVDIARSWSETARRLNDEFKVSVGFVDGKRCLGGMLELLMHCHYLVSQDGADLGMPEVTLPVVPGMEGCHWPFRKTASDQWPKLVKLLASGASIKAKEAAGWLVDYAGPMDEALKVAWNIVTDGDHGLSLRPLETGALKGIPTDPGLPAGGPDVEAARKAIVDSVVASCEAPLADAIGVQAKHSAGFMSSKHCRRGVIGAAYTKTMKI